MKKTVIIESFLLAIMFPKTVATIHFELLANGIIMPTNTTNKQLQAVLKCFPVLITPQDLLLLVPFHNRKTETHMD
jgi:hypothetical protein